MRRCRQGGIRKTDAQAPSRTAQRLVPQQSKQSGEGVIGLLTNRCLPNNCQWTDDDGMSALRRSWSAVVEVDRVRVRVKVLKMGGTGEALTTGVGGGRESRMRGVRQ